MASLAVARWFAVCTARTPLAWGTWVLLAATWPLWRWAAPRGIESGSAHTQAALYELAFVGALVGAAFSFRCFARGDWLLALPARTERLLGEWLGTALVVFAFASAPLAAHLALTGALESSPGLPVLAAVAHTTAATLLVTRTRTPVRLRAALLVALLWWIPSALADGEGLRFALARLLDVPGRLASLTGPVETPIVALADMAPSAAATLAAWLLHPPAPARR